MRDTSPTRREVLLLGVLPTLAALLVAATILIERIQLDWTLTASSTHRFLPDVWLAYLVAFGLAHIAGADRLREEPSTPGLRMTRLAKAVAFLAAHAPMGLAKLGAYFFALAAIPMVGAIVLAGGLDGSPNAYAQTPIFQAALYLLVSLAVVLPGIGFGALLAWASAPARSTVSQAQRKRRLVTYVIGGAVASAVFMRVTGAIDNQSNAYFAPPYAWLDAMAMFSAAAAACGAIWLAAVQAAWPSGNVVRSGPCWLGLGATMLGAFLLACATHVLVTNDITIFGENGANRNPLASFVRSGLPTLSAPVMFNGLQFVGPRSAISARSDRDEYLILVTPEWKPPTKWDEIRIEPQPLYRDYPSDCMDLGAGRKVCAGELWGDHLYVFEFDASVPEAVVNHTPLRPTGAFTLDQVKHGPKCFLQLSNVPTPGIYAFADVACDNWAAEAQRLKSLLARWFTKPKP